MSEKKTVTMRITRDECRLFAIMLKNAATFWPLPKKAVITLKCMANKFESVSNDKRRNSHDDNIPVLIERLNKKYHEPNDPSH